MEKLKMETKDMTQQNIEKIGALFPNVITEIKDENGKLKKGINFELLKQELSKDVVDGDECYDFTWVGKKAAIVESNTPIRKTLRPCVEESEDWENTENLYIEGDNLDVLKLLQESYLNSIKMIYIDPPYNTGNDFIYKDNFKIDKDDYEEQIGLYDEDENRMFKNTDTNGRFHSDWCSMMYPRLKLAHNLLTDDGVMFISIDDNEVDNLKKMCNEIFGENNLVSQLVWEKKKKGAFLSKHIINMKEYILVFSKNFNSFKGLIGEKNESPETYPCIKTTNPRGKRIIRSGVISKYKEKNYNLNKGTRISSGNMELIYLTDLNIANGVLVDDVIIESNWIYTQESLDRFSDEGLIYITQDLYIRRIVEEERVKNVKDLLMRVGNDGKSTAKFEYTNNLNNNGWGTNEDANAELHEILDVQNLFDFSKPSKLIAKLIQSIQDKNSTILDFFSGSSTTADAVIQLNVEDSGNRKFIMVQLPDLTDKNSEAYKNGYYNICEIGKERIRRVGENIKLEVEQNNSQLKINEDPKMIPDIGFRVLKVDSTNMKDVYYSASEYTQSMISDLESNIKEDRTDLDLLYGVMLEWGLKLSLSHKIEEIEGIKVHIVDEGSLVACFENKVTENVIREIAKRQPLRVVFRDSSFENSPDKINVAEIFKLLAPNTTIKVI